MKKYTTSERLKQIMTSRNLKQVDILEKCKPYCEKYGVKLNKNDLSQYVSGKVVPKQDKLSVLGSALGVSEVWLMGYDTADTVTKALSSNTKTRKIPVLGRVAAGTPIEMVEDIIGYEDIPDDYHGDYFALQIHGDSMEPKISEGDVVIVKQQPDIENGQIAIITIDGDDATCKRVVKYADGIMLISSNPKYQPMQYTTEDMKKLPIRVLGRVVELRAKF